MWLTDKLLTDNVVSVMDNLIINMGRGQVREEVMASNR